MKIRQISTSGGLFCLLLSSCSSPSSDNLITDNSGSKATYAGYTLLKINPNPALSKISITVLLPEKISEQELQRIGSEIKATHKGYGKTWIAYYLKGMKPGAGAWAITNYTPEPEVKILGASQSQEDVAKKQAAAVDGKVLGQWYEEQYTHSSLTIYQKGATYYLKTVFDSGQSSDEVLLRRGQEFTYKAGGYNGEYFQLLPGGQLGLFNQEGKMFTQAESVPR